MSYRFEMSYQGKRMLKTLYIPKYKMGNEDNKTPRIPIYNTIPGCIMSLDLPHYRFENEDGTPNNEKCIDFNIRGNPIELYLYNLIEVPFHTEIIAPAAYQVSDSFYTGERWITSNNEVFIFIAKYTVRVHMHIPNCAYSRYAVTREGYDEVLDAINAPAIYGDENAFSYIALNPFREQVALDYVNANKGLDAYMNHQTNWR